MTSSSNFRKTLLCLGIVGVFLAGWLVWNKVSTQAETNSQVGSSQTHEHTHTHGGGMEHGHDHDGTAESETHSHPHEHGHQHSQPSELAQGLVEVGHLHGDDGTVKMFLAKAVLSDKEVEFKFFEQNEGDEELNAIKPPASSFTAQLFNGSNLEAKLDVELKDEKYVGALPEGFFCLPAHTLRVSKLILGGEEMDVVLPLAASSEVSAK